ncbi:helix-turn-helix transcriptional regulator [Panacibacter ginsenosidivorans]|uniref:Helix-turn-helix transcriptional regulator n=1 Tax=Panacibacter ginsenosidivorans TaxID=1813871 RepID=A0A5B8VEQ8_9BACT|nr:helix-turn-helix transcriptional regulator [Panacibacter ginsenosidivorans]QEC69994.1 helix-turn-helix transcriptional regulator [Panacibacter ginsenosidivorans]
MGKLNNNNTWLGFMKKMSSEYVNPQHIQIEGIEKILSLNQQFNNFFYHSIPAIYLLDYTTGKYLIMSNSSQIHLGYKPNVFMENGIGFTIDSYHKDDLQLYNEKMFPDRLETLKAIPPEEQQNYVFSYSFRLKNSKGAYVNLLQRNCFVKSDSNGMPLLSLGMVINVEHFKKENPVVQLVEKINPEDNSCEPVYKKTYYLKEEEQLISKREKEILLWMAEGLTSNDIANKLFISEHTVINHRKNMLLKYGVNNVAALIAYALRNNII